MIGTAGLGSRSSSVSSQDGSVSWLSLGMPELPSYRDVTRDVHMDQPLTPLLDDFDGDDSPIFMNPTPFCFPPPPVYTEVTRPRTDSPQIRREGVGRFFLTELAVLCRPTRSSTSTPTCCRCAESASYGIFHQIAVWLSPATANSGWRQRKPKFPLWRREAASGEPRLSCSHRVARAEPSPPCRGGAGRRAGVPRVPNKPPPPPHPTLSHRWVTLSLHSGGGPDRPPAVGLCGAPLCHSRGQRGTKPPRYYSSPLLNILDRIAFAAVSMEAQLGVFLNVVDRVLLEEACCTFWGMRFAVLLPGSALVISI